MRRLALLLGLLFCTAAQAEPILADLSIRAIDINATFRGTQILLFGARSEPGDIVVVVRGPDRDYVVRKKERVAGVWVNYANEKFTEIPSFYAVASSTGLEEIINPSLLKAYDIGESFTDPSRYDGPLAKREFWSALVRSHQRLALYPAEVQPIYFWGESLFRTALNFPKNIPEGTYKAEIYLLRDGELVALQSTPIVVEKVGFEAYMHQLAHKRPLVYGLLCVVLAGGVGYMASRFFRKA